MDNHHHLFDNADGYRGYAPYVLGPLQTPDPANAADIAYQRAQIVSGVPAMINKYIY